MGRMDCMECGVSFDTELYGSYPSHAKGHIFVLQIQCQLPTAHQPFRQVTPVMKLPGVISKVVKLLVQPLLPKASLHTNHGGTLKLPPPKLLSSTLRAAIFCFVF